MHIEDDAGRGSTGPFPARGVAFAWMSRLHRTHLPRPPYASPRGRRTWKKGIPIFAGGWGGRRTWEKGNPDICRGDGDGDREKVRDGTDTAFTWKPRRRGREGFDRSLVRRAWTRCKGAWRVRWTFSGILLGVFKEEGSTVGWWLLGRAALFQAVVSCFFFLFFLGGWAALPYREGLDPRRGWWCGGL